MNVLQHFGVNLDDFKPVQGGKGEGRILLYDGDGACYDPNIVGVAKLETAFRRFEMNILEQMYRANCTSARVHLTPKGCNKNGRHLLRTVKPYQENRVNKPKPILLDPLRAKAPEYFQDHTDITVIGNYEIEADDALMIDAFTFNNTCMISADKDLNINPFESYVVDDGKFLRLKDGDHFGWVERKQWFTPSGKPASKVIGKGTKFFWAQMLMGDTADNVKGIITLNGKSCGEAGAYAALEPIKDESECMNFVLDGYRVIDQNVIAEAEAMWLLRSRDDSSIKYMQSLDLSPKNKAFLESWIERGYTDEDLEENNVGF